MALYIGIDLGGTNIAAGLVNENCELILKKSVPTGADRPAPEIIRDMALLALDVIKESGHEPKDIASVGVGCPGTINRADGEIVYANNLPFRHTQMKKIFSETFDVPFFVDNDANAAALGEAYAGAAKGCDSAIMITLGTGVGGGIIIDKRIYGGFNFAGGELGHMVIEEGGWPCTCGRKGCWEAYSSATGLIKMTVEAMQEDKSSILWQMHPDGKDVSGKSAFIAMRKGDAAGKKVVDKYMKYLATGLVNIINIFQPEVLVIGGGVAKEGKPLFDPLDALIDAERYTRDIPQTQIKPAVLGNDAGIIGAAMLCK